MTRWRPALLLVAAVVATGCGPAEVVATATCAAPVRPPAQEGSHLLGDTEPPVPYSSAPPTSGWHRSGRPPLPGVYGTQLPDPDVVAVLEAGGVVVAHDGALAPAEEEAVASLLDAVPGLVVTPYAMPGEAAVAIVGWGVLQRCDTVDADAVSAFAAALDDRSVDH